MEPGRRRTEVLAGMLDDRGIEAVFLTDADSIFYFSGYAGYLGMDFGRPTMLIVRRDGEPVIVTPLMESEMCARMTWVADIRPWSDGIGDEWRGELDSVLVNSRFRRVGVERNRIPTPIMDHVSRAAAEVENVDDLVSDIRMVKSPDEIAIMKQAGQVAVAMVEGARKVLGIGVPEYEIALAAIEAGTRSAAALLDDPEDRFASPTIYNLQVLQSGSDTCYVHRRSSLRRLSFGDPVYLCFCGIANFRNYKLGFDREFFLGRATDRQAHVYAVALSAQQAALAAIGPGVSCETVNAAAEEVYLEAGFTAGYRTGRSVGLSFLEAPELKRGESRMLEVGMTFAVDGGITLPGEFGARVGDSIVVTSDGFEYLTQYPRDLAVL